MLTIVYVPPGKDGHMIDTFFHANANDVDALMGLADPDMKIDVPCVGDVQSENIEGQLSDRARKCLEYCKTERPGKYDKMVESLGALAEKHGIR